MDGKAANALLNTYCYGPADLVRVRQGDSTMWLSLRDSVGRRAQAIYHDCVYWRLDARQTGLHLSLVQKVDKNQLLAAGDSVTLRALRKNTRDVGRLLQEWEDEGLSFYLHLGSSPGAEFLVVARSLDYREDGER